MADDVFFIPFRGNESSFGNTSTFFLQNHSINRSVTCDQRIQDKLNPSPRSRFSDLEHADARKVGIDKLIFIRSVGAYCRI